MKKAVVYTRVSTDKEEQQKSLEIQEMQYTDFANSKGYDLINIYADIGSGTSVRNRPNFIQMLHDAGLDYIKRNKNEYDTFTKSKRKPKFNFIIVKDQSRLSRNMQQGLEILQYLRDLNVFVIFENSGFSTEEDDWKMKTSLLFMLAEEESRALSRRIKSTKKYQMLKGKYKPAVAPIGYKRDKEGNIVIDEEYREVIEFIYKSYLVEGTRTIANKLNEKGIRTKRGAQFTYSTVNDILKNKVYCGSPIVNMIGKRDVTDTQPTLKDKEDWIELTDAVEPIVSKELWEAVQDKNKKRVQQTNKNFLGKKTASKNIYYDKAFCECGTVMVRNITTKKLKDGTKKRAAHFICRKRRNRKGCDIRGITQKYIDRYIEGVNLEKQIDVIKNYVDRTKLIQAIEKLSSEIEQAMQNLKQEIHELNLKNEGITKKLIDNIDSPTLLELLEKEVEDNSEEIRVLENRLSKLSIDHINQIKLKIKEKDELITNLQNNKHISFEQKLELLDKIIIGDNKVVAQFKLPYYDAEIALFNEYYPDYAIDFDEDASYSIQQWRRNHKAAREYWERYDKEQEEIYKMKKLKEDIE